MWTPLLIGSQYAHWPWFLNNSNMNHVLLTIKTNNWREHPFWRLICFFHIIGRLSLVVFLYKLMFNLQHTSLPFDVQWGPAPDSSAYNKQSRLITPQNKTRMNTEHPLLLLALLQEDLTWRHGGYQSRSNYVFLTPSCSKLAS
jgi:hypothetical protein